MDTTIKGFKATDKGCNFCCSYEERIKNEIPQDKSQYLKSLIKIIKAAGKRNPYDCIIGVSGGVDSSYIAHLTKSLGLRPLAVHFDNGWNSELAVSNIQKLLENLNIELHTHVVEWEEFKDLQKAFIQSSINNLEIPTDHAITALLFQMADKFKVKYIISGSNLATEGILPTEGIGRHIDYKLLLNIHKQFGTKKLKTFPKIGLSKFLYYLMLKRIKYIPLLNYITYVKDDALKTLQDHYQWKAYGGKHYESIFTRFFQGYILPVKYNYDKRKAHLSTLIMSGQVERSAALKELKTNPYSDLELLEQDKFFLKKKFGFSDAQFDFIMTQPIKNPEDYPSYELLFKKYSTFINFIKNRSRQLDL